MSTNKSPEPEAVGLDTPPSSIHIEHHQPETCPSCVRRSDWDFLKDFFVREEVANHQVQQLSFHANELRRALQHAGLANQNDRIALNKAHEHIEELQRGFHIAESTRARLEKDLSETQLEHRVTTENLAHERRMHEEAEQEIKYVWEAHYRLQDMFATVKTNADDFLELGEEPLDITEIVLDNERKQSKIESLKKAVKEAKEEGSRLVGVAEAQAVGAEDRYLRALEEKDGVIARLEARLRPENLGPNLYADGNHGLTGDPQKPSRRRTRRGKGRGGRRVVDQVRSEDVGSSEPSMGQ